MISYDNKVWIKFVFFSKGAVLGKAYPSILLLAAFTAAIYILQFEYDWLGYQHPIINVRIPLTFHSLLGVVLGLLLVFRTNTAYDRWWEGRKIWGALLNSSRNFARQISIFIPKEKKEEKELLIKLIVAFSYALKEHLRKGVKWEDMQQILPESILEKIKSAHHIPNALIVEMAEIIHHLYEDGTIKGAKLKLLDANIKEFTDYLGMCERIRKTPMPIAYSLHLKRIISAYIVTLPFGLIHDLSWGAVPAVVLVTYTLVGIEIIGEEIEDPFGTDDNDLPTDDICRAIHLNTHEINGLTVPYIPPKTTKNLTVSPKKALS